MAATDYVGDPVTPAATVKLARSTRRGRAVSGTAGCTSVNTATRESSVKVVANATIDAEVMA